MQIILLSGTKYLRLPQYVNKRLVCMAQKIWTSPNLGPVKGQGKSQSQKNGYTFDIAIVILVV